MPISIQESCEPFSPVSFRGTDRASLIESDAYRLLLQEARRYLAGEVRGRSFLVAGHRGSGKTTVVLQVCQQLRDTPSLIDANRPLHPMVVLLHGPNLLPDAKPAVKPATDQEAAEIEPSQKESETAVSEDEAQNALVQITLGLYRSLAEELARAYRRALEHRPPGPPRRQMELMELAAQFELELDRCPEPSRLREYWSRAGLLPGGALFLPESHPWLSPPLDQGFRELLALASACEMYRRISGTFTSEEERKAEAEKETKAGIETDTKAQDLLKSLAALLTGGVAFAATPEGAPIVSAVTGLVAALGAATVFKVSSTRSRKRTFTEETKFVRNLTVATLDREIPVLIERACAAGLVPLFVVDELDKIVGLSGRITSLVRRLKKLVAERAFFCFLTDRDYFEEMRSRTTKSAYPMEHTYFTHRLFIVYKPQDLHRWLAESLDLPAASGGTTDETGTDTGGAGETALAVWDSDGARSEEAEDLKVLPYVLLHQAKMHPIDLRRRLAQLTRQDRTLALQRGDLRTRGNLCDLMIQLAVEIVLDREEVREVLEREHSFRQLVYDALYYASRRWEQAEYELDLGDDQEEAFGKALVGRMRVPDGRKPAEEAPTSSADVLTLPVSDRKFLFRLVRELCALLADADGAAFRQAFLDWETRRLEEAFPSGDPDFEERHLPWATVESFLPIVFPLLVEDDAEPCLYRWCRDRAGVVRPDVAAMPRASEALAAPAGADPFAEADSVRAFAALLVELSRSDPAQSMGPVDLATLTSGLHILAVAPAWAAVDRALARLDSAGASAANPEDPQVKEDLQTVREFYQLLGRGAETLALALLCGAILGQAAPTEPFGEKLLAGLRALSQAYGFDRQTEAGRLEKLEHLRRKLKAEGLLPASLYGIPRAVKALDQTRWAEWCQRLRKVAEDTPAADRLRTELPAFREQAWSVWRDRLAPRPRFERGSWPKVEPVLEDLVCGAARVSPASRLDLDLGRMNLVAWSEAVFWALVPQATDHPQVCPPWIVAPALYRLGLTPPDPSGLLETLVEDVSVLRKSSLPLGEELREWLGRWERSFKSESRGALPAVLVIRREEGSLTSSWKVPKKGGVLTLTENQLGVLLNARFPRRLLSARLIRNGLVAIEVPRDDPSAGVPRIMAVSRELFAPEVSAAILVPPNSLVPESESHPVIQGPKNADDLIERARPFLARSGS